MDKINVYGLSFFAHHGVFEDEKINGQQFSIDCEFGVDTSTCGDDLTKTVHYGEVSLDIIKFSTENRFDLLEMLANNLAKYLLKKYPLMQYVTLTVHKPQAPIPTEFADVTLTITRKNTVCYLGIGSNLGEKEQYLNSVINLIEANDNVILLAKSSFITTKPYGVTDQPDFLNGVLKIKTNYSMRELLEFCKLAEQEAGRIKTRVWGERTLDVDILMYGNEIIFTDDLIIPHAEMHKRDFVLKPLCEIEPYLIHPILKTNMQSLLQKL